MSAGPLIERKRRLDGTTVEYRCERALVEPGRAAVRRYLVPPDLPLAGADLVVPPGAVTAAVVLEASFQVLPVFVRFADVNVTLRVLGGPAILLLWLYVMANVIVFGAEINWWRRERARARADETV